MKKIGFTMICAAFIATAAWDAIAASAPNAPTLTIFNCDGSYLKVNAASGGSLASGMYGDFKERQSHLDGCLISDIIDQIPGALYAVISKSPRADKEGNQRFSVVSLDSKTLKVIHRYDLPEKYGQQPSLLFDAARQNLIVTLGDSSWQRLSIAPNGELVPLEAAQTLPEAFPVSPFPYVDEEGNIIDGARVLNSQGRMIQEIQGDSLFDSALQEKFASLTQIKGSSEHYYDAILAASAADRMVFTVGWDRQDTRIPSAGILVYDLHAGKVITSFNSAFAVAPGAVGEFGIPSLHLSPDGRQIVIEEYAWRPDSNASPAGDHARQLRFRTGRIAVYDATTGGLRGTLTIALSQNDHAIGRVVNFSSDGRYLYYLIDGRMSTIDLEGLSVAAYSGLPNGFDPVAVVAGR
jgi:acyl-CoA synthetase (AMP-forming)/AMP-acid ligase II